MHLTNALVSLTIGVFSFLSPQTLANQEVMVPQTEEVAPAANHQEVTEVNPVAEESNTATTTEEHITKDAEETFPGEACNCYRYVKNRIDTLPAMALVLPNTTAATGTVAIEWFDNVKHVSIVTAIDANGVYVAESNYHHCKVGTRYIPFDHYSLVGFWSAS